MQNDDISVNKENNQPTAPMTFSILMSNSQQNYACYAAIHTTTKLLSRH